MHKGHIALIQQSSSPCCTCSSQFEEPLHSVKSRTRYRPCRYSRSQTVEKISNQLVKNTYLTLHIRFRRECCKDIPFPENWKNIDTHESRNGKVGTSLNGVLRELLEESADHLTPKNYIRLLLRQTVFSFASFDRADPYAPRSKKCIHSVTRTYPNILVVSV